jgi:adenylate kinase
MPDTKPNRYRAILLFGMPGSGKGTQGAVLDQLPGFVHISSGDLFRKLPVWGELGREVVGYTSQGLLVPDDLTVRIYLRQIRILELQELLLPAEHILVLDGLPRNYEQARTLASSLDVIQIFHLKIHDIDRAILRLKSRALRENRPDDTSEELIRRRIRVYHEQTAATLKAYDPAIIFDVDADQSPLAVHCDIVDRLRVLEGRRLFHSSPGPDNVPDSPDADSLPAPAASR